MVFLRPRTWSVALVRRVTVAKLRSLQNKSRSLLALMPAGLRGRAAHLGAPQLQSWGACLVPTGDSGRPWARTEELGLFGAWDILG